MDLIALVFTLLIIAMSMIGFSIFKKNDKITPAEKTLLDHLHNDKFKEFKTVFEASRFSPNFVTYVYLVLL